MDRLLLMGVRGWVKMERRWEGRECGQSGSVWRAARQPCKTRFTLFGHALGRMRWASTPAGVDEPSAKRHSWEGLCAGSRFWWCLGLQPDLLDDGGTGPPSSRSSAR